MARFPDVFEGIGKFPGKPYKIQLDPNVPTKTDSMQACSYTS